VLSAGPLTTILQEPSKEPVPTVATAAPCTTATRRRHPESRFRTKSFTSETTKSFTSETWTADGGGLRSERIVVH
jgi:hypothetical protein